MALAWLIAATLLGAALPVAARPQAAELDVLLEFQVHETPKPMTVPPPSPMKTPPGQQAPPLIRIPEVEVTTKGPQLVYQNILVPWRGTRQELDDLETKGLAELETTANEKLVAIHTNPALLRRPSLDHGVCEDPESAGREDDLRALLGADETLKFATGKGVLIAVVDGPLNAAYVVGRHKGVHFDAQYSFARDGTTPGKGAVKTHGTMVAYLATVLAPQAALASISTSNGMKDRLEGALLGYDHLATLRPTTGPENRYSGIVVNNSWEIGDESWYGTEAQCHDSKPSRPGIIRIDRPCHAFNRMAASLAKVKVDLVFAAGNGGKCEQGAGQRSIRGPALHPDALVVAAVDVDKRRLFDSAQGALGGTKPDISGYSHYQVSNAYVAAGGKYIDTQTSAAAALVSGFVAALRSCVGPDVAPATLRQAMRGDADKKVQLASRPGETKTLEGPDPEFGAGVMDPLKTLSNACQSH